MCVTDWQSGGQTGKQTGKYIANNQTGLTTITLWRMRAEG